MWLCLLLCTERRLCLEGEGIIGGGYTRLQAGNTSRVLTRSSSRVSTGINLSDGSSLMFLLKNSAAVHMSTLQITDLSSDDSNKEAKYLEMLTLKPFVVH